jgi:hypothetical protein
MEMEMTIDVIESQPGRTEPAELLGHFAFYFTPQAGDEQISKGGAGGLVAKIATALRKVGQRSGS